MEILREMKEDIQGFFGQSKWARMLMWAIVAFFPIHITLGTNAISYGELGSAHKLIWENAGAFLFSFIVVGVVFVILCMCLKKTFIASILTAIIFYGIGIADNLKFAAMENHLYPSDFLFVKSIGNFTDFVTKPNIPHVIWEIVLGTLLYCAFLYFIGAVVKVARKRAFATVAASLVCILLSVTNETAFGISLEGEVEQNVLYQEQGFITAFILNFNSLNIAEPDQYSLESISKKFAQYMPTEEENNFQNPDIVVVLSESFWDPTELEGVTFSEDPLKNFRAIAETNPSGKMVSPTFGGGTVRPEFEVLTGMTTSTLPAGNIPYQQYMAEETDSFVWKYKNLGYDAVGIHTYQPNFYERDRAYPLMGFDEFLGEYDLHAEQHWNSGPYITDETISEEVIYQLGQERDNSVFVMAITMENHGLYRDKYDDVDKTIKVTAENLSDDQISMLENYAVGTKNSDAALKEIYDYVMGREKPTIVLWFGDHLPTLGEEFSPYTSAGSISSTSSKEWSDEEKMKMFSTPYLMFANYDTGKEYRAEDTPVSPYFLSALMADYIDAPQNVQTNFLLDLFDTSPVISKYYNLYTPNSDEGKRAELMELHELMTYDLLMGDSYILEMQR